MTESNRGWIVVGIDGSAASKAALDWAMEEARLRGATVHAVHAWEYPGLALSASAMTTLPVIDPDELEEAAEQVVQETLGAMGDLEPTIEVTSSVQRGQ